LTKWALGDLVNINALQTMADNLYIISEVPVGILDIDGNILVAAGWQDICTKYHRKNPIASKRCRLSDQYIRNNLHKGDWVAYKCLNNLWEVALPIVVSGEQLGTIFVGQFFYDNEVIDVEYFRKQAAEFGFDEEEYISALYRMPVFSKQKVEQIIEYYKGLVLTLVESSMARIQCMKADEKLRHNEARLRNLFKSMRDTVLVIDDEGRFTECYKSEDMTLHCETKSFLGQKYKKVMPPKVSVLIGDAIDKLKRGEVVEPFDYSLTIGDKTSWYSAQLSKVKGEGEGANEFMAVIRDITDKKSTKKSCLRLKVRRKLQMK
jgi:PAS domain S-box-containing protein